MIKLKTPETIEEKFYEQLVEKELYKQFKNAFDTGHIYLKITNKLNSNSKVLSFEILKINDNIEVNCDNKATVDYFCIEHYEVPTVIRFIKHEKEKATSKKQEKNNKIKFTANRKFIYELLSEYNDVKFQTIEEVRNQRKIDDLEEMVKKLEDKTKRLDMEITRLTFRILNSEDSIRTLYETKSNKFFI